MEGQEEGQAEKGEEKMIRRFLVLLVVPLVLAACSKEEAAKPEGKDKPNPEGTPTTKAAEVEAEEAFHDVVTASLKKVGLEPEAFEQAAARPYEAKKCARGEVSKLDVLVCDFEGEPAAQAGEKKLEQFVDGAVSGAVRRTGTRVLAVADRKKADLKGEGINKVLKAIKKM